MPVAIPPTVAVLLGTPPFPGVPSLVGLPAVLAAPADGPPLQPAREEAQRWAVVELSRREYQEQRESLTLRVLQWLRDRLLEIPVPEGSGSAVFFTLLTCLIVALVVVAVLRVSGRGGRARATRTGVVPAGTTTTAAQFRALADRHAAAADWGEAVAARFRAVARELEEAGTRVQPGMTAAEVASAGAEAHPALGPDLHRGGRAFDAAVYGRRPTTQEAYLTLVALDDALRAAIGARR